MKTLDKIIRKFCCTDRSSLLKPCLVEDFVYATNAHVLIKCPSSSLSEQYENVKGFPDCESAYATIEKLEEPFTIDLINLREVMAKIEKHIVYHECDTCQGDGVIECHHCGSVVDCNDCDGKGELTTVKGKEYDSSKDLVKINEGHFNPKFIELLIEVAETVGSTFINVLAISNRRAMICEIGIVVVLIMPGLVDPLSEIKIHKLEVERSKP